MKTPKTRWQELLWVSLLSAACVGLEYAPLEPPPAPVTQTPAGPASPAPAPASPPPVTQAPAAPASADPVVRALQDRPLSLTRHARCRMDCRQISSAEIDEVLREGTRDPSRTRTDGRCPSHALEDRMGDGRMLRVVFAACSDETRVVTAIDLDREWDCACD